MNQFRSWLKSFFCFLDDYVLLWLPLIVFELLFKWNACYIDVKLEIIIYQCERPSKRRNYEHKTCLLLLSCLSSVERLDGKF